MVDLDKSLLRAVLDSPEDNSLRLICADWFEEHGECARAEFVRLQIEEDELFKAMLFKRACSCDGSYPRGGGGMMEVEWTPSMCTPRYICGTCRRIDEIRLRTAELMETGADGKVVRWYVKIPKYNHFQIEAEYCNYSLIRDRESIDRKCIFDYVRFSQKFRRGFVGEVYCELDDWIRHGPMMVRIQPVSIVWIAGGGKGVMDEALRRGVVSQEYEDTPKGNVDFYHACVKWAREQPDPSPAAYP